MRLYRHVQRRCRLVGDNQRRTQDDRASDRDTLTLAARKLMGVSRRVARRKANKLERFSDSLCALGGPADAMQRINASIDVLHIPRWKVRNNIEKYGNTSAASIPLALDEARAEGVIKPGQKLVFSGFGAGLSWGTAIFRW